MNELYLKIKRTLESLLQNREVSLERVSANYEPLFLVGRVEPYHMAFSFLLRPDRDKYSITLEKLKKYYLEFWSRGKDLDIVLVICLESISESIEGFCISIENDPYFCRKFVIDISKELKSEFARLPFIPLQSSTIEDVIGFKRPVSCQTFLMNKGVNTELGRNLVTPHRMGEERIVERCLEGTWGAPDWIRRNLDKFVNYPVEDRPKRRLKRVEIANFRAYRQPIEFDVDADIVVLSGQNGLGKTSFYDAVDFAATGGIARFDDRYIRRAEKLIPIFKHLDSSKEQSFVRLWFGTNDFEIKLERHVNHKNADIGGSEKNRAQTLMALTGLEEEPPDLRIDNFVRLFRATHLFGQDYQSLTADLVRESRLPEDTVSRMLAFQDYVEAIAKVDKVTEVFKRREKKSEEDIKIVEESVNSKQKELDQAKKVIQDLQLPNSLVEMENNVRHKIASLLNVRSSSNSQIDVEAIKDLNIGIITESNELTHKISVAIDLLSRSATTGKLGKEVESISSKISETTFLLKQLDNEYGAKQKAVEFQAEEVKKLQIEIERQLSQLRNYTWLISTKVDYEQLNNKLQGLDSNRTDMRSKLKPLSLEISKVNTDVRLKQAERDQQNERIRILDNYLGQLQTLSVEIEKEWPEILWEEKSLQESRGLLQKHLDENRNQLDTYKNDLNTAALSELQLKERVTIAQHFQSELKSLLDGIEKYIRSPKCPVCGTVHESAEDLLRKLKMQRGDIPKELKEALNAQRNAENEVRILQRKVDSVANSIAIIDADILKNDNEMHKIQKSKESILGRMNELNISISSENLGSVISKQTPKLNNECKIEKSNLETLTKYLEERRKVLNDLLNQQSVITKVIEDINQEEEDIQSRLNTIETETSKRKLSLDSKVEELQYKATNATGAVEKLRTSLGEAQAKLDRTKQELDNLRNNIQKVQSEMTGLRRVLIENMKSIEEFTLFAKELGLPEKSNYEDIQERKGQFERRAELLKNLQQDLNNFEIALNYNKTSATFSKLQAEIEKERRQLQSLTFSLGEQENWRLYFDRMGDELRSLRMRALEEYTRYYGPLTSTIQKRLRSFYGFGNIQLIPSRGSN